MPRGSWSPRDPNLPREFPPQHHDARPPPNQACAPATTTAGANAHPTPPTRHRDRSPPLCSNVARHSRLPTEPRHHGLTRHERRHSRNHLHRCHLSSHDPNATTASTPGVTHAARHNLSPMSRRDIRWRNESPRWIGVLAEIGGDGFRRAASTDCGRRRVSKFIIARQRSLSHKLTPRFMCSNPRLRRPVLLAAGNRQRSSSWRVSRYQLDSPLRLSRISYPVVAWALSLRQAAWVKWSHHHQHSGPDGSRCLRSAWLTMRPTAYFGILI